MRLIGMLASPYVRRVAISLDFMNIPFTHEPLSVFRHFDAFAEINPVVKAPTLVTDDGVALMDSSLILDYLERLAAPERSLTPRDTSQHARAQRIVGLALAACKKTVQTIYEHNLRPTEKQHRPWTDRIGGQLLAAYRLLEAEISSGEAWLFGTRHCRQTSPRQSRGALPRATSPTSSKGRIIPRLAGSRLARKLCLNSRLGHSTRSRQLE